METFCWKVQNALLFFLRKSLHSHSELAFLIADEVAYCQKIQRIHQHIAATLQSYRNSCTKVLPASCRQRTILQRNCQMAFPDWRTILTEFPQTNGICENFHKIILSEFYQIAFRKKIYEFIEMLQNDLDEWLQKYNESRPHSGSIAMGKRQCRHSWIPCHLQKRKCCSIVVTFQNKRKYDRSSDDVVTSTRFSTRSSSCLFFLVMLFLGKVWRSFWCRVPI